MKIIDENIKPYLITHENGNYDVLEDMHKNDKKGNAVFKTHGHYSSTENALNRVVKLLVEKEEKVLTIRAYINELKQTKIKITQ